MAKGKVCIDGNIVDSAEGRVSVLDRGFLYGDSVFEVYRTYGGVPFAEREHLERLGRSADLLMIPMPVSIDVLASEVHATLAEAGEGEWYVRVVVTRGTGPLTYDPTTARSPLRVIIVVPITPHPEELYVRGAAVVLLNASRPTDDARAAGAKASNYLANLLAGGGIEARGKFRDGFGIHRKSISVELINANLGISGIILKTGFVFYDKGGGTVIPSLRGFRVFCAVNLTQQHHFMRGRIMTGIDPVQIGSAAHQTALSIFAIPGDG